MTWLWGKLAKFALRRHYRSLARRMGGQKRMPVLEAAHVALDREFTMAWPVDFLIHSEEPDSDS